MLDHLPILTEVEDDQPYVDEPVYVPDNSLKQAIKKAMNLPHKVLKIVGYDHIKLSWMKRDGNGGLVPR